MTLRVEMVVCGRLWDSDLLQRSCVAWPSGNWCDGSWGDCLMRFWWRGYGVFCFECV